MYCTWEHPCSPSWVHPRSAAWEPCYRLAWACCNTWWMGLQKLQLPAHPYTWILVQDDKLACIYENHFKKEKSLSHNTTYYTDKFQ